MRRQKRKEVGGDVGGQDRDIALHHAGRLAGMVAGVLAAAHLLPKRLRLGKRSLSSGFQHPRILATPTNMASLSHIGWACRGPANLPQQACDNDARCVLHRRRDCDYPLQAKCRWANSCRGRAHFSAWRRVKLEQPSLAKTPVRATTADAGSKARQIVASGIVGNIIEWYDFALYGYLAPVTAQLFFPSSDPFTSLINTFAVFALGFLARPVGGVMYGHIGDRAGRRPVLIASIALMGASTVAMGLLPTYATAGLFAPVLLVLLRLLQGVSTGGEFVGSIAFLVEHAPRGRQGLWGSLANFGAAIGGALGAGVGWLTAAGMPPEALQAWGWRIPFLSALVVTAGGLWLRLRVPDSPVYVALSEKDSVEPAPLRTAFRAHKAGMATVFGLNWVASAGYYIVFVWLVTEMSRVAGLPLHLAMAIGTVGLLAGGVLTPVAGYSRIGSGGAPCWSRSAQPPRWARSRCCSLQARAVRLRRCWGS